MSKRQLVDRLPGEKMVEGSPDQPPEGRIPFGCIGGRRHNDIDVLRGTDRSRHWQFKDASTGFRASIRPVGHLMEFRRHGLPFMLVLCGHRSVGQNRLGGIRGFGQESVPVPAVPAFDALP
ncbi:MAG: hypothetical protein ACREVI_02200 [Steroidobacteraceae bacterium]